MESATEFFPTTAEYVEACRRSLPAILPVRTAAAMVAMKEESFRRHVLPAVAGPDGGVNFAALERHLDREYGALEYLYALHKLDCGDRRRDRNQKQKTRNRNTPSEDKGDARRPVRPR